MTDKYAGLLERLRFVGYLNSDNGDYGRRNPDGPEAAEAISSLLKALTTAREAIASLDEDAFGMATIAFGTPGVDVYPIRDELLSMIDAALNSDAPITEADCILHHVDPQSTPPLESDVAWALEYLRADGWGKEEAYALNKVADLLAALSAMGDGMLREALEKCHTFLTTAPLESGVCCCGNPVEGHGFGDGHSPVDELRYHASNLAEEIRTALGKTSQEAENGEG